jgi:hypothetical protein
MSRATKLTVKMSVRRRFLPSAHPQGLCNAVALGPSYFDGGPGALKAKLEIRKGQVFENKRGESP